MIGIRPGLGRSLDPTFRRIQIRGRNERLHEIREHVVAGAQLAAFGAAPQEQRLGDLLLPCPIGKRIGIDELSSDARQNSLVRIRETFEEQLGHAQAKHRVPQELEPLIVGPKPLLVGIAGVRERFLNVRRIWRDAK